MVLLLKIFLSTVWLFMVYIVISTSLASSLFEQWGFLISIPWMRATLWDFYANVLVIYLWVIYREPSRAMWFLWAVLFFALGSIGAIGYVLIQLFTLKNGEGVEALLKPKTTHA